MDDFSDLIERFDHVAYGVHDLQATLPFVELLGGRFLQGADHVRHRFRWVQFMLPGGSKLELLAPLHQESFLSSFLERRGEGIHHLTFKVHDIDAVAARAEAQGLRVVGLNHSPQWSELFLHPKAAHGSVIQFAQWDDDHAWSGHSLEDVFAGKSIDDT